MTLLLFSAGCSSKKGSEMMIFKTSARAFAAANATLTSQSNALYAALNDRMANHKGTVDAKTWQLKAMLIKDYSDEMLAYFDQVKMDIKNESGLHMENGKEFFREDNVGAVERLFVTKGKGNELYERLEKYKADVLNIDSEIKKQFEHTILSASNEFEKEKKEDFTHAFFNSVPAIAALSLLSQFENNIKVNENEMVLYCFNHASVIIKDFDFIGAIIGQDKTFVMPGQEISITAGIGAYSTQADPQIDFNGIQVPAENGVSVYRFKANGTPGKHNISVRINFLKPDGTHEIITKNIEYNLVTCPDIITEPLKK
ncbi:MAG: hypothetical protein ABJA78_03320 [Ferruginibacter sp.]